MDYLLPSAHEVPEVEIVHHVHAFAAHRAGPEGLGRVAAISARRPRSRAPSMMRCAARHFVEHAADPHPRTRRRHRGRARSKRKRPHDHRLPRPSGAAGLLEAIRKRRGLSDRCAPIEDARASLSFRRRQADAAGGKAAVAISPAASPGWTSRASRSRWSAAGSICSATNCRPPKAALVRADNEHARGGQSRAALRAACDRAAQDGARAAEVLRAAMRRVSRRHDRYAAARRRQRP